MPARPVVNASPLIYLSKGGFLDLLQLVGGEIIVPAVVASEILKRGQADPTVQALEKCAWLTVVETPPAPPIIQAWDLGPGESSVLAYAYATPEAVAILDDLAGRRCAEALNIPISGTLGLVLIAKRRGVIHASRPVLEKLRQSGMYLSDQTMNHALALIGE